MAPDTDPLLMLSDLAISGGRRYGRGGDRPGETGHGFLVSLTCLFWGAKHVGSLGAVLLPNSSRRFRF